MLELWRSTYWWVLTPLCWWHRDHFQKCFYIQNSIKHEKEDLVAVEEETWSTSPSPLELHEVGPSKKEEYEEVHLQEPHFFEGSLKMNRNNIQESLRILHDTKALVSNSCWKISSLEDPSFLWRHGEDSKSNVHNWR